MNNISIRKATKNDKSLIASVISMAIGKEQIISYCGIDYNIVLEELVCLDLSQYSYNNVLIAEVDGTPAGAVIGYDGAELHNLRKTTLELIHNHTEKELSITDETDASEFYLDSIAVLPEYRGMGIASKLILTMNEIATKQYNKPLGLLVDFENPKAERLYKSLGFERVEVKDFLGHKMWHLVKAQL